MKIGSVRAVLLATTSVAALCMGAGVNPAAACYTGPFPVNFTTPQSCVQVTNTTFSGSIVNSNTISPGGITLTNSSMTAGTISDNGPTLAGGISIDSASSVAGGVLTAIGVSSGTFAGGIHNAGHVSSNFSGISVGSNVLTFSGGITNTGSITVGANGILVFIQNIPTAAMSGGIVNTGTITSTGGSGINVARVSLFDGGVMNGGAITAVNGISVGTAAPSVSTFIGGVTNNGTITATGTSTTNGLGMAVTNVPNFNGAVVNNGALSARIGIQINNSTVTAGISNSNSLSAAQTGILLLGGATVGTITNSGNLSGGTAAINLTAEGAATIIDQTAGTVTGPILLSSLGDTVNITGGTVNGSIVGSGTSGTVNFNTGAGTTFTYAAPFGFSGIAQADIDSGTVLLNGVNTATAVAVNSGGTLAGTGSVGNAVTVNSGGNFSPGTPGVPGASMTVTGTLAFAPGSQYTVYVNPSTSSFSTVTGTASLNGTVNAVFSPGSYAIKQYLILQSAGLNGTTFSGLANTNLPPGFDDFLSYNADDAFLNLIAAIGAGVPLNQSQQGVANVINNFFNSGRTLPPGFENLFNLTGTNLTHALTQLEAENGTGAERGAFQLMNQFLGLMLDPFVPCEGAYGQYDRDRLSCRRELQQPLGFAADQEANNMPPEIALAYASVFKAPPLKAPPPAFEQRWTVWAAGFGGSATAKGDPVVGSNNVTTGTFGYAAGMDYHVSPDTVLGFALAGGGTGWNLAQGARHRAQRCVPRRSLRRDPSGTDLPRRRARLRQQLVHHQSHGSGRSAQRQLPGPKLRGAARRRLPLCCAGRLQRHRHHAVCGDPGAELPYPGL